MESVEDPYYSAEIRWPAEVRRTIAETRSQDESTEADGAASAATTDPGFAPVEVANLEGALDKALTLDLRVLPADVLVEMRPQVNRVRRKLDAFDAGFVEAVDASLVWARRGHANAAAFLRKGDNAHGSDAAARVRRANRLPKMPLVEAAFRNGLITVDHVRLLGELTERRWYAHFTEAEPYLLESAVNLSWREFRHVIDIWKAAAEPTSPDEKDQSDQDAREFHLSRSFNDRGIASGTFTPEGRVIVCNEIDRLARQLLFHDREQAKARGIKQPTSADLARTPAQRRHDAIVIMAKRSAAADADADFPPVPVGVRASQECAEAALAREFGGDPDPVAVEDYLCEFDDGTPMTYSQLVKYLVHEVIHRVIVDQEGEVINYGRGRRLFSPEQKAAMRWRDGICECGCEMLAKHCDADHHIEWDDGGLSDLINAKARCRRSHSFKTESQKRRRRQTRPSNDPDPPHW